MRAPGVCHQAQQRREQAALKECLRKRTTRYEQSAEAKAEALDRTLAKLEEQNRARFENINGRLDANTATLELIRYASILSAEVYPDPPERV